MKRLILAFLLSLITSLGIEAACTGSSPTWASTPDQASVQACVNSAATTGDTINISSGSATWTALTVAKSVVINGAGQGQTNITLPNAAALAITKVTGGPIRFKNITWLSSVKTVPHVITVSGPWPTGQPVIFQFDSFTSNGADWITAFTPGGIIISHCTQTGILGDTLITGKDVQNTGNSWGVADSIGNHDTTGFYNFYLEDNIFNGGNVTDCDDGCRIVMRFNVGNESNGFNSHGKDTSGIGMRHFEVYSNSFLFPDKTCTQGNTSPSNMNYWIWIRGGTGVIYNNNFDSLYSSCWGDKNEWKFAIRGAEDFRPAGTCAATTYPVSHQIGQNNNGTADFTDPVYIWGNISNVLAGIPNGIDPGNIFHIAMEADWQWNNPCGFNWNTFFQMGRDAINTSIGSITLPANGGLLEGAGGTAKPGYVAFTYPHPLVASGGSAPVLQFTPSSINFGNQNVGTISSPAQTITVKNIGTASETLNAAATVSGDYALATNGCTNGLILAINGTCISTITFSPTAQGTRLGSFNITGTVNGSATLTGNGTITISIPAAPTNLTASVVSSTVNLSWTASTGTPQGYLVSRGTVSGGPYGSPIANVTGGVTYQDTSRPAGTYYYVVQSYNTAGTSGNSNQASATVVALAPAVNLNPSGLNFNGIDLGTTSTALTTTVTNVGTSPLIMGAGAVTIGGANQADFAVDPSTTCNSVTVAVSATCLMKATFTPSIAGTEQATLCLASNASTSGSDCVVMNGYGNNVVVVGPVSLNLGNVYTTKTSATQAINYTNQGSTTVTIASTLFSTGDFSQFSIDTSITGYCTGTVLAGATCTINVKFTPTSNGQKNTILTIIDSASGSPRIITITGKAVGKHIVKVGVAF